MYNIVLDDDNQKNFSLNNAHPNIRKRRDGMLEQIKQQIERIKGLGATYVDTRWYPFEEANYLLMWNGNLKSTTSTRESGVGIRVLYKGAWGFSASSDLSDLATLFDKAFDNARVAAERVTFPVRLAEKDALQA